MSNEEFIKNVSLEGEEWRDVVGFEGLYMVSSFGRVISLERIIGTHNKNAHSTNHRLLSPNYISQGKISKRQIYHLYKGRKIRKAITAHRIVAYAFIPNPENYPQIDHIDGDPTNNNIKNLRWCTQSTNIENPITKNRRKSTKGTYNTSRSKKIVQIENETVINTFNSASEAERSGYNRICISLCCNNKISQHRGFKWMFFSDYETLINMSKNDSIPNK